MKVVSAAILLALTPGALFSQTVSGTVYDPATSAPISTAFVVLLDASDAQVTGTLTRSNGYFSHTAPAPGDYRLRVERIGYETVTSPLLRLALGETLQYSIAVPSDAIHLEGIVAEADQECRVRPSEGLQLAVLWNEARKALSRAAWTEDEGNVPFVATMYERARELGSLQVLEEVSRRSDFGYGQTTFSSASASDLARHGYVQLVSDNLYQYYGIDAEGLLSDAFLDTHCFRLEDANEPAETGLIGLHFEPIRDHSQPDITGVLWLDRATAELQYVEFAYTEHLQPQEIPTSHFGGRIDFRALPNGSWIVDRWWIRMPQVVRRQFGDRFLSLAERNFNLRIFEVGGEVTSISTASHSVRGGSSSISSVSGVILDPILQMPLAGATVFLEGTSQAAVTDSEGRFQLGDLPSGEYELLYFHPRLDSLLITAPALEVLLSANEHIALEVTVPDVARCPATATPSAVASGTLVGFIRNSLTGEPVDGAEVELKDPDEQENTATFRARTEESGRYMMCGVPLGEPVEVYASHPDDGTAAAMVTLTEGGVSQRDLALLPLPTVVAGVVRESQAGPAAREYPPLPLSGTVTQPTVQGRLVDAETEDPITGATVKLKDLDGQLASGTLTDSNGAFVLPASRVGRYTLEAQRIGYANVTSPAFDVLSDELLNVQLRASVGAIPLAPLTITAERLPLVNSIRLDNSNFYERRDSWGPKGSGFGHFLDEEEIDAIGSFHMTDLLRGLPGVQVQGGGGRFIKLTMRGRCVPTIYLDGDIIRTWQFATDARGTELNRLISPESVVGVEVYPGSTKPAEFMDMGEGSTPWLVSSVKACGSIVIWTG